MLAIKIIKGPSHKGQNYPLENGQTRLLGRSQGCDIRLESGDVSKRHCRLTVFPGGKAEVEDLGSSNGTYVNGVLVKKHIAKVGDFIGVSNYILQLNAEAPDVGAGSGDFAADAGEADAFVPGQEDEKGQKLEKWLGENVHPWADKLSAKYDIRLLTLSVLLIWVTLSVVFSVVPFSQTANRVIEEESIQVARLYARQLARLNQNAILEQRYSDLIEQLDAKPGQTPGIIRTYILDVQKRIILAPAAFAGNNFPNRYAVVAAQKDGPWTSYDEGIVYVSEPIRIGVPVDGRVESRIEALAFVEYDSRNGNFSATQIVNQIVNALIIAILLSILVFTFLQHWIEGSIAAIQSRIQTALKNSEAYLQPVSLKWQKVSDLLTDMESLMGRLSGNAAAGGPGSQASWASGTTNMNVMPSAAFDEDLVVTAWNPKMEELVGIRSHIAIGNDISGASRDLAFESTVRALADDCLGQEWTPQQREFEMSGDPYIIAMVYGQGAYFLNVVREELE